MATKRSTKKPRQLTPHEEADLVGAVMADVMRKVGESLAGPRAPLPTVAILDDLDEAVEAAFNHPLSDATDDWLTAMRAFVQP